MVDGNPIAIANEYTKILGRQGRASKGYRDSFISLDDCIFLQGVNGAVDANSLAVGLHGELNSEGVLGVQGEAIHSG